MIFEANIVSGYPNKVIRNELTGPWSCGNKKRQSMVLLCSVTAIKLVM